MAMPTLSGAERYRESRHPIRASALGKGWSVLGELAAPPGTIKGRS